VVGQVGHSAQAHVRQRADGERDRLRSQARDQLRVLDGANAMIDPLGLQQVERLDDVRRRPLLAGVGDGAQALIPRPGEQTTRASVCRR